MFLIRALWPAEKDSNLHDIISTFSIYRHDMVLPLHYPPRKGEAAP